MVLPLALRYAGAACAVGLSSLGAALGQSLSFDGTEDALTRQQESSKLIQQLQLLGLILIESGPALGLLLALILIFGGSPNPSLAVGIAEAVIGLCSGISALCASIASGKAVAAAGRALARQPYAHKKIATTMLILQSLAEAPIIFSLIIGLIIKSQLVHHATLAHALLFAAANITLALGTIGPAIGQGIISWQALKAIGLNQSMTNKIFSLTLLSEAFIETPLFFSFIIALKLIYLPLGEATTWQEACMYFGATLSSGLGSLGPSIGAAWMAGQAVIHSALYPDQYQELFRSTFLSQVIIETGAIYSLIISFIIASKIA